MKEILAVLEANRDDKYGDFQANLTPGLSRAYFYGVRTPVLREYAGRLYKDAGLRNQFMAELPHKYFEENQLHSFLIALEKDFDKAVEETERFLPYIDNWATCDQATPKVFAQNTERLLPYVKKWLGSTHTYTKRYAVGALMKYYLDDAFDPAYLEMVVPIVSEEYYINMMIAWYLATALAKQWEATVPLLTQNRLGVWVHNKTIQKARESYRITDEQKEYLKSLRRKEK